jgi:hypothetical protein
MGTHAGDRFALAVFDASRLRIRALIGLKTPPAGSFMTAFLFSHVPGPFRAIITAWPGFLFPATLMGFFPFAVLICLAGDCASWRFRAHMPFYHLPAARFFSRGSFKTNEPVGQLGAASGVWPREAAVPCYRSAPL